MEPTPSYLLLPFCLESPTSTHPPPIHTQPDLLTTPEATGYKHLQRYRTWGRHGQTPTSDRASRQQRNTRGTFRDDASVWELDVLRAVETRVTGGNWRRLSLMHIVVKGSWVRSSLGNVGRWVTGCQAMTPPHSQTHTRAEAIRSNCRKPVQISRLPPTCICSMPCTHL